VQRRTTRNRGFIVPAVVAALVLFGLYASTLMLSSRGELGLLAKTIERERAQLIADSAIALGRSLIFQNDFDGRWYKQQVFGSSRIGFKGQMQGRFGDGTFTLVAEDVANDGSAMDVAERVQKLTYNRTDLFAEGRYGSTSVIVVKSLFWHPEQQCYGYTTTSAVRSDGTTGPVMTDIHVR